ncbi:MAG: BadF/BadG/BcrA/BcrD ATPase family protein [Anaerolineales bacterium]
MTQTFFLGVDAGGTKTHALIADETGRALGFGAGGPGNWEAVGLDGLTSALRESVGSALKSAGLRIGQLCAAGLGLAGYDWPSQKAMILGAIAPLGLNCPLEVVNDATLGILAGTSEGWGVSIVSGTGNNCRGRSRDGREGRVVGGASHWSGEYAGGWDIALRAMRAVTFEWNKRGPATALTPAFIQAAGAKNLDDLIEGMYLHRFQVDERLIRLVFQVAAAGDPQALEVMRWAGRELGDLACGVIRQLGLENETVEVVLIGSVWQGHPLLIETARQTIQAVAPRAQLLRLAAPPVTGGVVLAMQQAALPTTGARQTLLETLHAFTAKNGN